VTEVAFHFNLPDKAGYLCRLLRKMTGRGAHAVVLAEAAELGRLDSLLWTFSPHDFLAHCRSDAGPATLASSPVVLAERLSAAPFDAGISPVLVNLAPAVPDGFEKFERLIELVGEDDEDRRHGRLRWKFYQDRGYPIQRHDLGAAGEPA
jgi:DNA polymerase-3 subunit chi